MGKYNYTICNFASEEFFKKQCKGLEKHIPNLTKKQFLKDVDGSLIQIYQLNQKEIRVVNDASVDVVYIESDIDIEPYFNA